MKVLFVCTGNSCRSPMAEYLFNHHARLRDLQGWTARSAGTAAERHFGLSSGARVALTEKGILKIDHVPQLVTRDLMAWADLVLVMAQAHREVLADRFPEHQSKTHLFLDRAGLGARDVADPIGGSDDQYRRTRDEIEAGILAVLEKEAHGKPERAGP